MSNNYRNVEWLKRQLFHLEREQAHRVMLYEAKKRTFTEMLDKAE